MSDVFETENMHSPRKSAGLNPPSIDVAIALSRLSVAIHVHCFVNLDAGLLVNLSVHIDRSHFHVCGLLSFHIDALFWNWNRCVNWATKEFGRLESERISLLNI